MPTISPGGLESKINPYFGKCDSVTLVTAVDSKIKETNIVQPQGPHTCAALPQLFVQNGADTYIVGGIGGRSYMLLQQNGIKTYSVGNELINRSVQDIVLHFLTNNLLELEDGTCNHQNH
jgi:predicted Fe-Mo cluster-binding NifX family protein